MALLCSPKVGLYEFLAVVAAAWSISALHVVSHLWAWCWSLLISNPR